MEIEIKRLIPELVNDYIEFFDHVAFADNEEWAGCYCVWYHTNEATDAERKEYEARGGKNYNRMLAIRMIKEGSLKGYLAYADGAVAGWCNANDKTSYSCLTRAKSPELWSEEDDALKIKLIVCYTIAPDMRRNGIATQLLEQVCQDAAEEGYDCVEAIPGNSKTDVHRNYHGPRSLYEKSEFSLHKELDDISIMRKYLK